MAPSIPLVAALLRLADANLDEQSMLQMPVVEKTVETDTSDCACPAYYEEQCTDNAFQGCVWSDAGDSNAPWCQCDPNFVPTLPLYTGGSPPVPAPADPWILIAHQDVSAGYFASNTKETFLENADDATAGVYMIAGQDFSEFLHNGQYRLRLVYTGDSPSTGGCQDDSAWTGSVTMEWLQSSWVTDATVTGFEDVSEGVISAQSGGVACEFHGLARSSSDASVLDGSPSHGNWWNSVGGVRAHEGAIPAFRGRIAQAMSLYVSRY